MSVDTKLRHELEVMDEEFSGDNMVKMLGMSTLNWMNVDSSRQLMFNSHIKQLLTLVNPDVPRIQTGFENTIGSYSNAYKKLEGVWEVKDIIKKFPDIPNSHIYTVVFYIYESFFENWKIGLASAAAVVLFFIVFALTLVQLFVQKKLVFYK